MKYKKQKVFVMLLVILLGAYGLVHLYLYASNQEAQEQEQLTVVTSFFPMYIAAENIVDGAEDINLQNLSEPQTGCLHDYQLTPEDMKLLSKADVFIVNGGGIEEFLTDVAAAYPNLKIINASEGLDLIEDNSHAWMSVPLYRKQVENIANGLAQAHQEDAELFTKNQNAYDKELAGLQAQIDALRDKIAGNNIIIFHEAYEYVAEDYGLNVVYIMDLDEERQVSAGEVADVMSAAENDDVACIFAEEAYGADMGKRVTQQTGVKTYYLQTLVRGTYDKNSYVDKMQENIDTVKKAFGE